jgi:ribosomal protein L7/L12
MIGRVNMGSGGRMDEQELAARFDEISARLDHIEAALKISMLNAYTPWAEFVQKTAGGVPDEVVEMVRAGKRLQAMKRYMDLTGVGMATARQVIESIT